MSLDLDFNSPDFRALSRKEQVAKCREMASEAVRLAQIGSVDRCRQYSELAVAWTALADEMDASLNSN